MTTIQVTASHTIFAFGNLFQPLKSVGVTVNLLYNPDKGQQFDTKVVRQRLVYGHCIIENSGWCRRGEGNEGELDRVLFYRSGFKLNRGQGSVVAASLAIAASIASDRQPRQCHHGR